MRIVQIVEVLAYGDAIGGHVTALHEGLLNHGVEAKIYAGVVESRMSEWAEPYEKYEAREDDRIILHMSIGSDLNLDVLKHGRPLIVDYHNVTPPEYFEGYNRSLANDCRVGREQLRELAPHACLALADSAYNAKELVDAGFTCPVHVVPILLDFGQYDAVPNRNVMRRQAAKEGTKLLFVGRIAPNKRQELVMQAFYEYKRLYDSKATLTFVGGHRGALPYYLKLRKYARKLGLTGITFTGHVDFDEMLAYYQSADVFVCESSHEGFCVPLIECMYYRLPIVAYGGTAVGETLGNGGVVLPDQLPRTAADAIHEVMTDPSKRRAVREAQAEELKRFDKQRVLGSFLRALETEAGGNSCE